MVNNIYEQDFYDFSYGFRKKRSAHQALKQVHSGCMDRRIRFVLDADIQGCFDNFDHQVLRDLLRKRVKDKWILRLIDQWLKVGIVDGDTMHRNHKGTPQEGRAYKKHPVGVFSEWASLQGKTSPLLCNIYLHYALDEWLMQMVKPLLKGEIFIIRYADDFVIGFENYEDARKVMDTLPKRMAKYGLKIHPEKSKLVEFGPYGHSKPPTIDFIHRSIDFKGVHEC